MQSHLTPNVTMRPQMIAKPYQQGFQGQPQQPQGDLQFGSPNFDP